MSDITKLTNKILTDAEEKKAKMITATKKDVEIYLKQQQLTADTKYQQNIERFEKELRHKLQNQVSKQHIITRNKLLKTKQELLEAVYQKALDTLQNLDATSMLNFVERIITNSGFAGEVEVRIGEKSKNIFTDDVCNKLKTKFAPTKDLQFSKTYIPEQAGIMLMQDGVEINYTFEAILRTIKDEMNAVLVNTLFPEA